MAKEDFCFTYYDGDALRDMSHMDRLERGGYNDIVLQQRKFGRMTLDQIKKVLGKDFTSVWPSIELVLKFEGGKYWIDWLEFSIEKMRAQAKHQSQNGKKGGRKKAESNPTETQPEPKQNQPLNETKPLEDGDGFEDVINLKNKKESKQLDFKKPDINGDKIIFPVDTPAMRDLWAAWKEARWHNYELKYGLHGEQSDLRRMQEMNFHEIQDTIQQAIAGKWKNLYPEKNGTPKNKKQQHTDSAVEYVANYYGDKPGK